MSVVGFKKKAFLLFSLLILNFSPCLAGTYSGGDGSVSDPFQIATPEDLNSIGDDPCDWNKHFILTEDIDMAGYTYPTALISPEISDVDWRFDGIGFTGVFDGNGLSISNFSIDVNNVNNDYLGLFGCINTGAEVRDLEMLDVNIIGGNDTDVIGALAGKNLGDISDCNVTVNITCGTQCSGIGGLVGGNDSGSISGCNASSVIEIDNGSQTIGGLAGYNNNSGSITNCSVDCNIVSEVSLSSVFAIGGLLGVNASSIIQDCYAKGVVSCPGADSVGGLVGESYWDFPVMDSVADVNVLGRTEVGGLAGHCTSGIKNCSASGNVSGHSEVGGLAGLSTALTNCFATGDVYGSSSSVGGLVGWLWMLEDDESSNCYATGNVIGGDSTGGLAGWSLNGKISNCYAVGLVQGGDSTGGLIGFINNCTIKDSYATGHVEGGIDDIGGLVGSTSEDSIIVNCKALGNVTAPLSNLGTGGLVGENDGTIYSCYANGNVIGTDYLGGLIGINEGAVSISYAVGDVNGQSYLGGLIGKNTGDVEYSYHLGDVNGSSNYVGGLIGYNMHAPVSRSFASGCVTGQDDIGGLCGYVEADEGF
ncbi:MAG: GLUG motif-containing protein, partial [Planctomycetota bacterium]